MPTRVRVAVVALAALVAYVVVQAASYLTAGLLWLFPALVCAGLGGLLLVATIRGRPLGWQAARFLGVLAALGATPFVVILIGTGRFQVSPLFLLCGLLIVSGLSQPDALKYFDLYCGHCRSTDVRAIGFWFRAIACRKCGRRWKPHGHRVDPSVFE